MRKSILLLLVLFSTVLMHADSNVRLQNQSYTQSYQEHLFPVFEGQSRTREMDCTRHTRCKFGIVRKDYTGVIIGILFVAFILVMGFIGGTSRSSETTWVVSGGLLYHCL
jgi:hypothetical protein